MCDLSLIGYSLRLKSSHLRRRKRQKQQQHKTKRKKMRHGAWKKPYDQSNKIISFIFIQNIYSDPISLRHENVNFTQTEIVAKLAHGLIGDSVLEVGYIKYTQHIHRLATTFEIIM